jgi:hypothetical protein
MRSATHFVFNVQLPESSAMGMTVTAVEDFAFASQMKLMQNGQRMQGGRP